MARECILARRLGCAGDLHAAGSARGGSAAVADRGADAPGRAGGELLVPTPPGGLPSHRGPLPRARRGRHGLRRGLRDRGPRAAGRAGDGGRRKPGGPRARTNQVRASRCPIRSRSRRVLLRALRRDRLPPDDRASPGSGRGPGPLPDTASPRRGRLRVDAQCAHARPRGRRPLGQSVARSRVPGRRVPRALRGQLRRARAARALPRGQAPAPRAAPPSGLGLVSPGTRPHRALLRLVRPRHHGARLRATARSPRSRARLPGGPAMSERGELAIVLHTHMPYVEGFGTWPFGEEWLWEAVATVYLPLLRSLRGAPVTVCLTPVLCDQLETLEGEAGERFLRFLREIRAPIHGEDAEGFERVGEEALAAEVRRAAADYRVADVAF